MRKKPFSFHSLFYSVLLVVLTGTIFANLSAQSHAYAQSHVAPTFSCLGPCSPTKATSAADAPSQQGPATVSLQPSIASANTSPFPSQPCLTTSLASLTTAQAPAQHSRFGGKGGKKFGGKSGVSGSFGSNNNNNRGGFLGGFFQLFLTIINLLLKSLGSGGLSLPCSPSISGTPLPSSSPSLAVVPSINIAPSPLPISSSPTTPPSTVAPTSVLAPTTQPTAPSNLTPHFNSWGGYTTATTFSANSAISANWIVTALDCSGGDGTVSPWPGFGGYGQNDQDIAQLGNDMDCSSGKATYPAWTEAYPASSVYSNNTMKAGDQMTATVTFQGSGKFATTMTNKTEGWTITTPMQFSSSYVPQTAEVILEELGDSNNQNTPVPKFAPLTFTNNLYSLNGQQKPLTSAPGLNLLELGSNGNAQVTTSGFAGSNFTETFVHQ